MGLGVSNPLLRRQYQGAMTGRDLPDLAAQVGSIVQARRIGLMKDERHHQEMKCLKCLYLQSALF